jgi:hypothetical protein
VQRGTGGVAEKQSATRRRLKIGPLWQAELVGEIFEDPHRLAKGTGWHLRLGQFAADHCLQP